MGKKDEREIQSLWECKLFVSTINKIKLANLKIPMGYFNTYVICNIAFYCSIYKLATSNIH